MNRHVLAGGFTAGLVLLSVHAVHGWSWRTPPVFQTGSITIGPITRTVEAEGTLQARETVLVGSQVSGTIAEIQADFNSVVHRGQVLARLDPSLVKAEIEQARATLAQAKADADQARVSRDDASYQLDHARALRAKDDIAQSDLDAAEVAFKLADANVRSMDAQIKQAQAQVDQGEVDLRNTVIVSPVDGVVIARDVEVGQTVASRLEAPKLFEIAEDLTHMQAIATVDEADIGVVVAGQLVHFTVGAYPGEQFSGIVRQVRLNPDTSEGGVEYNVVIDVDNTGLKLRPGMTPTVSIEVARRERALQVPDAALRFVPGREVFEALGERPPADLEAMARAEKRASETRRGYLWVFDGHALSAVPVALGISNGVRTEVSSNTLQPGSAVVTGVVLKP